MAYRDRALMTGDPYQQKQDNKSGLLWWHRAILLLVAVSCLAVVGLMQGRSWEVQWAAFAVCALCVGVAIHA